MPGALKQVNGVILDDGAGVVPVDTGLNTDEGVAAWRTMLAGPLVGRPLTRIVVTHFHPDHSGLAGWLSRRHDAPIAMSRSEWLTLRLVIAQATPEPPAELLAFRRACGWSDEEVAREAGQRWDRFAMMIARLPVAFEALADGDRLTIGGREWEVVTGNGHSPDHVCLLDRVAGVLIAGDQVLPRISSNVSVSFTEPGGDPLGDWLSSIAKLRRLPADLLVIPGHGMPFRGLHDRLDALAAEHRERLDALAEHLATPRRARDCFPVLFRRAVGADMLGLATGEALAHLRRLEVEGSAVREARDGVWWFARA